MTPTPLNMLETLRNDDPPCDKCHGACCKGTEKYSVMLIEGEKEKFPESQELDDGYGVVHVIPRKDGKCIYLTNENKCSIYNDRPSLCRSFNCVEVYSISGRRCFFMDDRPDVADLIENLTPNGKV